MQSLYFDIVRFVMSYEEFEDLLREARKNLKVTFKMIAQMMKKPSFL